MPAKLPTFIGATNERGGFSIYKLVAVTTPPAGDPKRAGGRERAAGRAARTRAGQRLRGEPQVACGREDQPAGAGEEVTCASDRSFPRRRGSSRPRARSRFRGMTKGKRRPTVAVFVAAPCSLRGRALLLLDHLVEPVGLGLARRLVHHDALALFVQPVHRDVGAPQAGRLRARLRADGWRASARPRASSPTSSRRPGGRSGAS